MAGTCRWQCRRRPKAPVEMSSVAESILRWNVALAGVFHEGAPQRKAIPPTRKRNRSAHTRDWRRESAGARPPPYSVPISSGALAITSGRRLARRGAGLFRFWSVGSLTLWSAFMEERQRGRPSTSRLIRPPLLISTGLCLRRLASACSLPSKPPRLDPIEALRIRITRLRIKPASWHGSSVASRAHQNSGCIVAQATSRSRTSLICKQRFERSLAGFILRQQSSRRHIPRLSPARLL